MAKRGKKKGGLQRKVSSVFKQVSVPQQEGDQQLPTEPAQDGSHGAPSRPMSTDSLVSKSSLMKKVCRSQGSSDKATPDQNGSVPSQRTTPNHSNPQLIEVEESLQAIDLSAQMAPNEKSGIPPKPTTPDHPTTKDSSVKKAEQVEATKETIEPDHKDTVDSQTPPAVAVPTSQTSTPEKSHQAQSTQRTMAPDWAAEAPRASKSTEPPSPQKSEPEKRYGPEAPQKENLPSTQPETMTLEERKGPGLRQRINSKFFASDPGVSSTRQKAMVVSIPILIIILIFAFRQVLSTSPTKSKGASSEDDAPLIKASGYEIDWKIPELIPEIMRDPTQFPNQNDTTQIEPDQPAPIDISELINLGGIMYSHDKSSAIINGRIVHAGDVVSGFTVLKINRDSVEFERDGEKWVLKVED